jgi:hypothetical protein
LKLIKVGIKLGLVALIVNATWHVYLAYSAHYKFRDSATVVVQNRGDKTDAQLHEDVLSLAAESDIPMAPDGIVVKREGIATNLKAQYTREIDLLPGRPYPWPFSFEVSTFSMTPGERLLKK